MGNKYIKKEAKLYNREKSESSINGTGETQQQSNMLKKQTGLLSHTMYENKHKVD